MIAEIGHYALVLAFFVAVVQAVLPMIGAQNGNIRFMAIAKPTAFVQLALLITSFTSLTYLYVTSDFSVLNVVQNSHTEKPFIYKISGVWANHEGSLLLWTTILGLFGSMVALFGDNLPPRLKARVLSVQAMIAIGFYLFMLLTSNPFNRIFPLPLNGQDLNPLLQDVGLAMHPPMLYLGYVGFSITFSFAIAALIEGKVDAAWARWVRPWTLTAWLFLTAGIALGSWWAYYELGWGGWWFWDPVENSSFMPWLVGTALLHSASVVEKRNALKGWTILLAIITFSFSLLGTFLVRSGVLTSVHAFASDPARGVFILALLIIVTGGSLMLYAIRAPKLSGGGLFQPVSREGALLLNNIGMTIGVTIVLLGTLYPLFLDATTGNKVTVGAPFFIKVFIPLMIPILFAMAIGPFLNWKRSDLSAVMPRLWLAGILAFVAMGISWMVLDDGPFAGVVGMGIAVWLFVGTLIELSERVRLFKVPFSKTWAYLVRLPRATWGMTLGHLGMAIAIAGMAGAGTWSIEKTQSMKPGDSVTVSGYTYTFQGAKPIKGPNYMATSGSFVVTRNGQEIVKLYPENRIYNVSKRPTTEAAIYPTFFGDLYAVIGDESETEKGAYVTRLYYNPLVPWLWFGSVIMVISGLISLSDRRHRIGAPKKSRGSATQTTAKA